MINHNTLYWQWESLRDCARWDLACVTNTIICVSLLVPVHLWIYGRDVQEWSPCKIAVFGQVWWVLVHAFWIIFVHFRRTNRETTFLRRRNLILSISDVCGILGNSENFWEMLGNLGKLNQTSGKQNRLVHTWPLASLLPIDPIRSELR